MVECWSKFCLEFLVYIWCPISLLLGGFALGDDFASLEEFFYMLETLFGCPSFGGELGGFVFGTPHLEVSLVDAFGGLGGICFGCFGDWWCFADDRRLLTRMDDVTSSRRWSDKCVWSGSDGFLLLFHASWVLHTLRVGSLKPLLVGSKRTLVGSSEELDLLLFQMELKDLQRLKSSTSPHAKLYLMVFINE